MTQKQQEALTREIEATKQSLEGLEDEYKKFGSVTSQQLQVAGDKMKEVGGKISDVGEVNTRFGLTGDALEDLSTKFVEFATLNSIRMSALP